MEPSPPRHARAPRRVGPDILDLGALERGAIFSNDFEKNELYARSSANP